MKQWLEKHFGKFWMAAVFLFLYLPLMFMIVFSFNSTRQDANFTGFSLRWYEALMRDTKLVEGFFLSLQVAAITGVLSAVLGTFAAFVLVRYRRFSGRTFFSGMVNAPLVMPEVVMGRPAFNAIWRAMFMPVAPSGLAQPMITSSTSAASIPARCTACCTAWPPSVAPCVMLNEPFQLLASGVRAVETITAEVM